MSSTQLSRLFSSACFCLLSSFISVVAQTPTPTPPEEREQDPVKVFTEEVRMPVIAVDQFGNYDPTVEPDDVLVLEDGVSQQVRSVRRIPANVLLVLDTGGELSGLGGQSKRTSLTRNVAIALLRQMRADTQVSVLQYNNSVELVHAWSTDKESIAKGLRSKLSSGKRARFSDALVQAALMLSERPEGSRHLVLITDGVDVGGKAKPSEAIKQLMAARATVHIISYTEFVRQKKEGQPSSVQAGQLPNANNPIVATDPTLPPGATRSPTFGVGVRFDPAMRRQRKAYEAEVKKSEAALTNIAQETGGQIFLPKTSDQMIAETREVAREIGAEYVVTYRPRRPLADAPEGEYRRVEVASRRVGLNLRARRGYVVPRQN